MTTSECDVSSAVGTGASRDSLAWMLCGVAACEDGSSVGLALGCSSSDDEEVSESESEPEPEELDDEESESLLVS